jgi:chaperonin cofactor prefoldin
MGNEKGLKIRPILIGLLLAAAMLLPTATTVSYAQTTIPTTARFNLAGQVKVLEKRLERLEKKFEELSRSRRRNGNQLDQLTREIQRLKSDADRGILSDMRLKKLLSQHLEMSRKLEKVEESVENNRKDQAVTRGHLVRAYEERMASLVSEMTREKDRSRALELTREFFEFRKKADAYRTVPDKTGEIAAFSIELDPLDGPREINEKADLMRDRIARLEGIVKQIDRQIERLKKQAELAREMRQMIEEGNLFEEGVKFAPSPRALPIRRPDEGSTSGSDSDSSNYDSAGVHTSSLLDSDRNADRAVRTDAIESEIDRLENQKKFLLKVIEDLKRKVKEFGRKAKEVSVLESRAPARIAVGPKQGEQR